MKIGDQVIEGDLASPNEDVLVLPRRNTQIVITARAFKSLEQFEEHVKKPDPKKVFQKGKGWLPNLKDKTYLNQMERYGKLRVAYYVVKSLEPSNIEWPNLDTEDLTTWDKWEEDFLASGFTQHECNLILGLCLSVNNLDERKMEQSRDLFVLGQEQLDALDSQKEEQNSTQSGELAKE